MKLCSLPPPKSFEGDLPSCSSSSFIAMSRRPGPGRGVFWNQCQKELGKYSTFPSTQTDDSKKYPAQPQPKKIEERYLFSVPMLSPFGPITVTYVNSVPLVFRNCAGLGLFPYRQSGCVWAWIFCSSYFTSYYTRRIRRALNLPAFSFISRRPLLYTARFQKPAAAAR